MEHPFGVGEARIDNALEDELQIGIFGVVVAPTCCVLKRDDARGRIKILYLDAVEVEARVDDDALDDLNVPGLACVRTKVPLMRP